MNRANPQQVENIKLFTKKLIFFWLRQQPSRSPTIQTGDVGPSIVAVSKHVDYHVMHYIHIYIYNYIYMFIMLEIEILNANTGLDRIL